MKDESSTHGRRFRFQLVRIQPSNVEDILNSNIRNEFLLMVNVQRSSVKVS